MKANAFAAKVASANNRKLKKPLKRADRSRKEANQTENRQYYKDFVKANEAEYKSWVDNDVFELVDLRKKVRKLCPRTLGSDHQA